MGGGGQIVSLLITSLFCASFQNLQSWQFIAATVATIPECSILYTTTAEKVAWDLYFPALHIFNASSFATKISTGCFSLLCSAIFFPLLYLA